MSGAILCRNRNIPKDYARQLYDEGYCDQQIADKCGVSYEVIRRWRKRNDLPGHKAPYRKKETKRKSTVIELAAEAKAHGMSYGQYMASKNWR